FNAVKLDIFRSKGEFRSLQIRCYLQRQELEKLKNLLFASRYSPPIYATKELYWKSDLIFMKKFNNFSDNILSQKMILEHKNYLFEVPLLDINRLIDLQVKGMNRFVDSQEI
ncbi:MAG: competence protein, partial [Liquorilactobacillus sp.]